MKQQQRDRTMKKFREGKTNILVATDVAARGIDADNVEAVFNYDLPQDDTALLKISMGESREIVKDTAHTRDSRNYKDSRDSRDSRDSNVTNKKHGMTRLFINVGKKQRIKPGDIVKRLRAEHMVPAQADIPLEYDPDDVIQIDWG